MSVAEASLSGQRRRRQLRGVRLQLEKHKMFARLFEYSLEDRGTLLFLGCEPQPSKISWSSHIIIDGTWLSTGAISG